MEFHKVPGITEWHCGRKICSSDKAGKNRRGHIETAMNEMLKLEKGVAELQNKFLVSNSFFFLERLKDVAIFWDKWQNLV